MRPSERSIPEARGLRALGTSIALVVLAFAGFSVWVAWRISRESVGEPATAFVDVVVVPMDENRVLRNQTVVVRGGRIAAIGPAGATAIPRNATTIDGRNKYLVPGLADMHTHVQSEAELLLLLAHGVTTIREMFGCPYKLVWRDRIARGEMLGPAIYTSGPIVDGRPPNMAEMAVVETEADAERVVAEQKRRGYDFVKVYHGLSRSGFEAVLGAAKRHRLPVAGHVSAAVGLRDALRAGLGCVEHLDGFTGALQRPDSPFAELGKLDLQDNDPWIRSIDFVDEAGIPALAGAAWAAGAWSCPTLVTFRKWGFTAEEARAEATRDEMRYVHPILRASWLPANQADVGYSDMLFSAPEEAARMKRRVEIHKRITKALADAGAGVLLGTDAGATFVIPGVSALEELELLVEAGLTPYQALLAGTRNAAVYLGALEEFGAVAVGRRADLVLLEGDPLEDVANMRRRAGVMVRGRWLAEPELRRRLEEMALRQRSPKDWFDGRPLPAAEGRRETSARYEITSFGIHKGEERLTADALPDGRRVIASELVAEEPEERYRVRYETGGGSGAETVAVEIDGREGKGRIELRLVKGSLRALGRLPIVGDARQESTVPPSRTLGAPGVARWLWLLPRVEPLASRGRATLDVSEWDFGPAFELATRTLKVTREPDAAPADGEPRRVYEIETTDRLGVRLSSATLTVDTNGVPVRMELRQGEGVITYRRLEDGRTP